MRAPSRQHQNSSIPQFHPDLRPASTSRPTHSFHPYSATTTYSRWPLHLSATFHSELSHRDLRKCFLSLQFHSDRLLLFTCGANSNLRLHECSIPVSPFHLLNRVCIDSDKIILMAEFPEFIRIEAITLHGTHVLFEQDMMFFRCIDQHLCE